MGDTIRKVQALVGKIARTNTTVLITGESGTGKEVVARLIHRYSDRAKGPFVPVNCGALPEALLESELFGYERGALTGAVGHEARAVRGGRGRGDLPGRDRRDPPAAPGETAPGAPGAPGPAPGRHRGAAGGRPGDRRQQPDLRARAERGQFRQDLYFRLNILHMELPPLRERQEDLPVLAEHFLTRFCRKLNKPPMTLAEDAMEVLRRYPFQGNVRELENLMERCVALNAGGPIGQDLFPDNVLARAAGGAGQALEIPQGGFDLEGYLVALKGHFMRQALERCRWQQDPGGPPAGHELPCLPLLAPRDGWTGNASGPSSHGPMISRPPGRPEARTEG